MQNSMEAFWRSSLFAGGNAAYLEDKFEQYIKDPGQLSAEWRHFFDKLPEHMGGQTDQSHEAIRQNFREYLRSPVKVVAGGGDVTRERKQYAVHDLIHAYRLLGHLYAKTDPLELKQILKVPELELFFYDLTTADFDEVFDAGTLVGPQERTLKEILDDLNRIYCGTVASEYMHIPDSAERIWLENQIESKFRNLEVSAEDQYHILEGLTAADGLEKYLGAKYPGAKRFGLEGCESLIVALDALIQRAGTQGCNEVVIGMAHRGRLNVLVNILGKTPSELFDEFEGKHSFDVESGDVKYHQGFSSDVKTDEGYVHLSMAFNPSHLEIVTPVICGSVRARQLRRQDTRGYKEVMPIAIHGDAAFAGQGVVMETLNMSQTRGYKIGGTIHIITNNQVGFTTSNPYDARSTLYCSDLGKMLQIPIFHVNAEDPEGLEAVMQIALAYRNKFHKDVIIDLIGYRRHGHNEADEPRATQPMMYQIIRQKKPIREMYANKLNQAGIFNKDQTDDLVHKYRQSLDERERAVARHLVDDGWQSEYSTDWTSFDKNDWRYPTDTKIPLDRLLSIAKARDVYPNDLVLQSRVKKIYDDRQKMTQGELLCDWGYAETLAYATLLTEGFAVRLSGQDCGRGTFFHRHAVIHNQTDGQCYIPLCHMKEEMALEKCGHFEVIDSLLSEMAVLGFEYGYSTSEPRALVIWEAQFGDFANGAQVVIDQFISSGEQKWGRLSGLTMFLPHGYEGQGPEHSSARLERYLQLCAQHNIQVCVPSTPAQIYHMLRRQMLRPMRKPLVVMTPKSLLRHKSAVSTLEELSQGEFKPVIDAAHVDKKKVTRLVMCSGKVYYELAEAQKKEGLKHIAILRVEQLYPFPEKELEACLAQYPNAKTVIWCQEEPQNQGVWYNLQHHFRSCMQQEQMLDYAGREPSAAPAAGYMHLHLKQQQQLVNDALGLSEE